ncbi:MAG TPA: lipoprotein [Methylococcaceae bacterium]|nr:lipoprotein [Methylococcaceae bacterium]
MTRTLLLLLGTAFLTACGQKGPLYLPPPEGETAQVAPKAAKPRKPAEPVKEEETLTPEENRLLSPETAPAESPAAAPPGGGESPPEIQPLSNP